MTSPEPSKGALANQDDSNCLTIIAASFLKVHTLWDLLVIKLYGFRFHTQLHLSLQLSFVLRTLCLLPNTNSLVAKTDVQHLLLQHFTPTNFFHLFYHSNTGIDWWHHTFTIFSTRQNSFIEASIQCTDNRKDQYTLHFARITWVYSSVLSYPHHMHKIANIFDWNGTTDKVLGTDALASCCLSK